MSQYTYLFGPVPSRRFGRSLGVDLVPMKTCDYSCVFCQLGSTETTSIDREEHVPTGAVIEELGDWFGSGATADHVTLAGSGEPTLHTGLGDVLDFIKTQSTIPSLLLSNGSLFFLSEVREASARADAVKVSVSAWDQASFERINRPHPALQFDEVLGGLREFRDVFRGRLLVEVMILDGLNSSPDDAGKIASLVDSIHPDAVHLNTPLRRRAEVSASPLSRELLMELCDIFGSKAEMIADVTAPDNADRAELTEDRVMAILRRHPSTAGQLLALFGTDPDALNMHLRRMLDSGLVETTTEGDQVYYHAK